MSTRSHSARAHRVLLGILTAAAITLPACGRGTEPTATLSASPGLPVTTVISPAEVSLTVGGEKRITAEGIDAKGRATSATFEWSSADPTVATVGTSSGTVTAIAVGSTTVTVATGTLRATATVMVRPPNPPASLSIAPSELTVVSNGDARLTAQALDSTGQPTPVSVEWSSADPSVATVGSTDGIVTGLSIGSTTVTAAAGGLRATATVSVVRATLVEQWATGATASSEWSPGDWSAAQAIGVPNVTGCGDDPSAWATLSANGVDWLELTYAQPVLPSEIQIHEVWATGSIVKVEVKNARGDYQTIYSAAPIDPRTCPRVLTIPVTGVTSMVSTVRVTVDQAARFDWNEIDAVRLTGFR